MNILEKQARECASLLENSQNAVLLSGAGMSTSAGLPDFRGPQGIYRQKLHTNPERIFDIDAFYNDPRFFYDFHREFLRSVQTIRPTFAHRFFASLEREKILSGIITQNIDALHQRAGSRKVYEIHGGIWKSFCTECGKTWGYEKSLRLAFKQDVPHCDSCGGVIKPDIVFFGEMVKYLDECRALAEAADLFFVIGSSLVVTPAALLPSMTRGNVVVVNKGDISRTYLPESRVVLHAEEDIDTFFRAVNRYLKLEVPENSKEW
ncbi:MAG: SIR2 family NAD-dependent protein deacylase [Thermovirgaceae bacterium]